MDRGGAITPSDGMEEQHASDNSLEALTSHTNAHLEIGHPLAHFCRLLVRAFLLLLCHTGSG